MERNGALAFAAPNLVSKYVFPDSPAEWIQPRAFSEKIRECEKKGVIFLTAPAGYGKTAAVRQLAHCWHEPYIYIGLDEYDNEPLEFSDRLSEALECVFPTSVRATEELVWHPVESAFALCDKLAGIYDKSFTIIIDNFHLIQNGQIPELLVLLMQKLSYADFVFISRFRPPDFMDDLQDGRQLYIVGQEHLRYSVDEFALLLEKNGLLLTVGEIRRLYEKTEGWPLCAGTLAQSKGRSEHLTQTLDKYLKAELWNRCDEMTREFLLKISTVEVFGAELCAELSGQTDSEALLERLCDENVFISKTLTGEYRFHNFFREFLLETAQKSESIQINRLYHKAADWWMRHGQYFMASDYYFRCGSLDHANQALRAMLSCGETVCSVPELASCLDALPFDSLPAETTEDKPSLLLAAAYGAYLNGYPEKQTGYYKRLRKVVRLHPDLPNREDLTYMLAFLGFLEPVKGITEILEEATSAKDSLFSEERLTPPSLTQGLPFAHRSFRDFSDLALLPGNAADSLWNLLQAQDQSEAQMLKNAVLAGLYLEKGDYTGAEAFATVSGMGSCTEINLSVMMVRAEAAFALNRPSIAAEFLDEAEAMLKKENYAFLVKNIHALRMRWRMRGGDTQAALEWLACGDTSSITLDSITLYENYLHFTTARALILAGETARALLLLERLRKQAEQYNRAMDSVEAGILLAVAHERDKNMEQALETMSAALVRARVYGFTESFTSEAMSVYRILNELSFRASRLETVGGPDAGFLRRLCIETGKKLGRRQVIRIYEEPASISLTAKQTEVARLLYKGHSYQEVANNLGIKLSTVKSYIQELYNKLGVFNVEEAIDKLYETGIFMEGM